MGFFNFEAWEWRETDFFSFFGYSVGVPKTQGKPTLTATKPALKWCLEDENVCELWSSEGDAFGILKF